VGFAYPPLELWIYSLPPGWLKNSSLWSYLPNLTCQPHSHANTRHSMSKCFDFVVALDIKPPGGWGHLRPNHSPKDCSRRSSTRTSRILFTLFHPSSFPLYPSFDTNFNPLYPSLAFPRHDWMCTLLYTRLLRQYIIEENLKNRTFLGFYLCQYRLHVNTLVDS